MSVILEQSGEAGFADRPSGGGMGLKVSLGAGTDGAYLEHDFQVNLETVYVRVMVDPATVSGGAVEFLRGLDSGGVTGFAVDLDGVNRQVVLRAVGMSVVGDLPVGVDWHCVEVMVDTDDFKVGLWVNGVWVGEIYHSAVASALTHRVRIGGFFKDWDTTGVFYLDELKMAEEYVGPVVVKPTGEYADDPARWLVVYNRSVEGGGEWAGAYRQARGVPWANLCGLGLSAAETISQEEFAALDEVINAYLDENGLAGQVMGILLGYGVPGYVDFGSAIEPVAGLLHYPGSVRGAAINFLAANQVSELVRPVWANMDGFRLTARVDGATAAEAIALVERATVVMQDGAGDGEQAMVWVDPYTYENEYTGPLIEKMVTWLGSVDCQRTRLITKVSEDAGGDEESGFSQIDQDGFFWGWMGATVPEGFFAAPAGKRVFCLQLDHENATGRTMRGEGSGSGSQWVQGALNAGYAAAGGSSRPYSLSAVLKIGPFFEALRRGWTLSEAWFTACGALREGIFLAGDPLMKVKFPGGGWDVYGPVDRLEELDGSVAGIMAALREEERQWVLSAGQSPAEGQKKKYLLRHLDDQGESELGTVVIEAGNKDGEMVKWVDSMVWPVGEGWPVGREGNKVVLRVGWETAIEGMQVGQVEVEKQTEGGEVVVDGVMEIPRGYWWGQAVRDKEVAKTRYRLVIHGKEDVEMRTSWSAWVEATTGPTLAVADLEVGV